MKKENKNSFYRACDAFAYNGKLGVEYHADKCVFSIWMPMWKEVYLRLYKAGPELIDIIKMETEKNFFWCEKIGCCEGLFYNFIAISRDEKKVSFPDPYACAVTEDGRFGIIVDMNNNKPEGWDNSPRVTSENPVVYEVSVRDFSMDESAGFTHRGKFSAFCEENVKNSQGDAAGLDHLKALGVTHVQLMPVFDFDFDGCDYNWGYNPRTFNAPCNYYARENAVLELRELVHTLHKNGIGVIFDVVYNHMYSAENSAFGRIFPGYFFRHNDDDSYSNGSGCGNEFASERAMARKFIIDSLEFIAREYKADGFRFDLMGLLDIKTLKKAERRLREINPDILLYGEGWTGGKSALPERRRAVMKNADRLPGFAFFSDGFRDAVKGSVFAAEDQGYINGSPDDRHAAGIFYALTGEYPEGGITGASGAVNYVECHDNLTLFDKLTASMKGADKAKIAAVDRVAAALVMFSKGIAFIGEGQEFLRSKGGNDNSYNAPDSVNALKWDMVSENMETVEYYKGLIALRKRFGGRLEKCRVIDGGDRFSIEYNNGEFYLFVNPTDAAFEYDPADDSEFEIYADKDRASDNALYTVRQPCCAEFSILFARRKERKMNRIEQLREVMKKRGVYAYIVPTDDFHGSEYVGEYFRLREYLSGFTGSAGTLVVTLEKALLWTDGRYFIQAAQQLEGSGIELMKSGEKDVPTIEEYLSKTLSDGSVLGFDGRVMSAAFIEKLSKRLEGKNVTFSTDEDLGGEVWADRPSLSKKPVFALSDEVCGASRADKIERIRQKMSEQSADSLVISALDEIAWALNLRGGDVDYNPVFLAFMIVERNKVSLFAERDIFSEDIVKALEKDGVFIHPYNDVYNVVFSLNGAVWLDPKAVNCRLKNEARNAKIIAKQSPIVLMKAIKNSAEIKAETNAHLKDGVAVTRFMYWLKHTAGNEKITEISAAEKLEEFRRMGENYLGQSFEPIMAYGEHGAIVHYSATAETDAEIQPKGMLLSDTGGHYADGTTDITRTFVLGELTEDERRAFTFVLAGHLELLRAVFPKETRGSVLDAIARKPLWDRGMNFNHGTGHGVGFLLNVHEGPQRISYRTTNDAPLEAGMITSDEPGFYYEGKFGIRHESLILCREAEPDGFLCFSPLTLVPFDPDGIEPRLLTSEQRGYLNDYHAFVYERIAPRLPKEEAEWLKEVTKAI